MDDQNLAAIAANQSSAVIEGDPSAPQAPPLTREQVEANRNAENLDRAKASGYVEPAQPSISERVTALVAGVQHAMDHNAPISREYFAEMKELLGFRNAEPVADVPLKAE